MVYGIEMVTILSFFRMLKSFIQFNDDSKWIYNECLSSVSQAQAITFISPSKYLPHTYTHIALIFKPKRILIRYEFSRRRRRRRTIIFFQLKHVFSRKYGKKIFIITQSMIFIIQQFVSIRYICHRTCSWNVQFSSFMCFERHFSFLF